MAKFVKVGYGSDGRGMGTTIDGYTYVVDDNVRTGQTIYPSVKHYISQTIFGTTGKVLSTTGENTVNGRIMKQELESRGKTIQPVLTGKEIGAVRQRDIETGKFQKGEGGTTLYGLQTRGANILARAELNQEKISKGEATQKAVETFESYSKKFMENT